MAVIDGMNINGNAYDLRDKVAVRFNEAQSLTEAQKAQARENIGATAGAVLYDSQQALTDGQKAVARNNISAVSNDDFDEALNYYTETDVVVSAAPEGWNLDGTGKCVQSSTYKLVKYAVTPGDRLHLKLSKDSDGVYQWQSSASVPSNLPNNSLVGTPVTTAIDGNVTVPTGATYLIVSQLKTNNTNSVKLVTADETVKEKIDSLEEAVVYKQQGLGNVGKALVVGSDGNVTTGDAGIPSAVKSALLACFAKVAWSDDQGQTYYNALYAALYDSPTPTDDYITSGLLAFWDGIDNTGSAHDGSATKWTDKMNGHEITLSGTSWGENCLVFSGSTSQSATGAKLWSTPLSNLTVEVVFRLSNATISKLNHVLSLGATTFISGSNWNEPSVNVFPDATVGFIARSSNSYTLPVAYSAIYKAAATYSGDDVAKAYVNGTEVTLSDKTHSLNGRENSTIKMGNDLSNTYPMTGRIYAVRVYNRQLSASELAHNDALDVERYGLE